MIRRILYLALFALYVAVRLLYTQPALVKPRVMDDTQAYLRISNQSPLDVDFWGSSRPFVFPLLLKIAHQDFPTAAALQLGFSILAWSLLGLSVAAALRTYGLAPFAFGLILALSLVRHLAGWDFTMLTESLSVSWFALFFAVGIWLLLDWRFERIVALILVGFCLAFTRDTNAYLLLMLAGLLFLAVILRWTQPRALILATAFVGIFLLNNANADLGGRWVFPFLNVMGRRVLPNPQAVDFFESNCGLAVTPALMSLEGEFANGQSRAFYNDPDLADFRSWTYQRGKTCYMLWLALNPVQSGAEAFSQFGPLVAFSDVDNYFTRFYKPSLPRPVERLLYPDRFILWIWASVTLAAFIAIFTRAWRKNSLWAAFILLVIPIFPHLFISWHGDAMAPARHALSVGLELYLSAWLLVLLLADQILLRVGNLSKKADTQR
ncbi:MAG: hypothetical protein HY869_23795 [Chloroflexi bacterium]|nr:hypothetical protein [Chloroflexota bacterium]